MCKKNRYRLTISLISGSIFLSIFMLTTHNPPHKKSNGNHNGIQIAETVGN